MGFPHKIGFKLGDARLFTVLLAFDDEQNVAWIAESLLGIKNGNVNEESSKCTPLFSPCGLGWSLGNLPFLLSEDHLILGPTGSDQLADKRTNHRLLFNGVLQKNRDFIFGSRQRSVFRHGMDNKGGRTSAILPNFPPRHPEKTLPPRKRPDQVRQFRAEDQHTADDGREGHDCPLAVSHHAVEARPPTAPPVGVDHVERLEEAEVEDRLRYVLQLLVRR